MARVKKAAVAAIPAPEGTFFPCDSFVATDEGDNSDSQATASCDIVFPPEKLEIRPEVAEKAAAAAAAAAAEIPRDEDFSRG